MVPLLVGVGHVGLFAAVKTAIDRKMHRLKELQAELSASAGQLGGAGGDPSSLEAPAMPAGARSLLLDMAQGYRQQSELAVSRLAQDAESRCAQWLLNHAQPDHSGAMQVTLHQRKRLIAAQLGIAPETFSRVLRHLRELGLIHGTGNVLALPQPRALQSMAGC